ncbi:MAG: hypothetical protein ABIY46_02205, partial [Gemmatimonadales bacterium]
MRSPRRFLRWTLVAVVAASWGCQDQTPVEPRQSTVSGDAAAPAPGGPRPDQQYLIDRFGVPPEALGIIDSARLAQATASASRTRTGGPARGLSLAVASNVGAVTVSVPDGFVYAYPQDVNEAGIMVGYGCRINSSCSNTVKWGDGTTTELPPPAGGQYGVAVAINDNGEVAGYAYGDFAAPGETPSYEVRAVRWSAAGVPTLLPRVPGTLGYTQEVPLDINNS